MLTKLCGIACPTNGTRNIATADSVISQFGVCAITPLFNELSYVYFNFSGNKEIQQILLARSKQFSQDD